MKLTKGTIKSIIRRLLRGGNYRVEVIGLIDDAFLNFAIDFFKKVAEAKLKNREITNDWYRNAFLDEKLASDDIAIRAGLNMKTIRNSYRSTSRDVVISASTEHYPVLLDSIKELTQSDDGIDLNLTIKFNKVSVDLNVNESRNQCGSRKTRRVERGTLEHRRQTG